MSPLSEEEASMKSHKDLDVWRLAVELATEVYKATKTFPKDEQYGTVSQMLRGLARSLRQKDGA
jgi:hypothetical protein